MAEQTPSEMIDDLVAQLQGKLGVRKGETLTEKLAYTRKILPKSVRKDAAILVEAAQLSGHPKLRLRVDTAQTEKAYQRIVGEIAKIDMADRRKGRILNILAILGFYVLLAFAALVTYLVWSGKV